MEGRFPLVVVMVNDGGLAQKMDGLARDIAKSLKCSYLRLDDILDNKDMSDLESIRLRLDGACRIAITQLRSDQSVIINCLTSFSQFSMLKPLYDSPYSYNGDAFVILHCYYVSGNSYEPSSDMFPRVSRLRVNTGATIDPGEVIKALNDLAYCKRGHVLELYEWKPFHGVNDDHQCDGKRLFATIDSGEYPYNNTTHAITELKQVQHGAYCGACLKKVSGEAYTCRCGCNVVLHRQCLIESTTTHSMRTPKSRVQLLQQRLLGGYLFPEPQRCKRCKTAQKDFSYECQRCLFQTLIKSGLPATYNRFGVTALQAIMIPQSKSYRCEACGKPGSYAGYSCFQCNKHYHAGCVFMPLSLTHRHGGWEHRMDLQFKYPKDEEGTFCDFCYKDLDPNFWFYACREGCYVTHVECVFGEGDGQEYVSEIEACIQEDDIQCSDSRHIITYSSKDEVQDKPIKYCILCETQISGDMYACGKCSFALHESCAKASKNTLQTSDERTLAFRRSPVGYPFVKSYLCPLCQGINPTLMPYECGNCIFHANLQQAEWPPLLHHKGHHDEHQLSFWAMPLPPLGKYQCYICDGSGSLLSYVKLSETYKCYHIDCLIYGIDII